MFNFFKQNIEAITAFSFFLKILIFVFCGFVVRIVYDKRIKITLKKFLAGGVFISLIIYSVTTIVHFSSGLLIIVSLFSGLGCKNLIEDYIAKKMWERFDPTKKIGKDDENKT